MPTEFDSLIALTIRIDGRLRERRLERDLDFACMPSDSTWPPSHLEVAESTQGLPTFLKSHRRWQRHCFSNLCNWAVTSGTATQDQQKELSVLWDFWSFCVLLPGKRSGSPVGASTLVGHMENCFASLTLTPFHVILTPHWLLNRTSPLSPSPFPWMLERWTGAL